MSNELSTEEGPVKICTRCGCSVEQYYEYQTKMEDTILCDNCCKYALMWFVSLGDIKASWIAGFGRKENKHSIL